MTEPERLTVGQISAHIGRIAILSAQLELVCGQISYYLLRSDIGFVVLSGQGWRPTLDTCERLIDRRLAEDPESTVAPPLSMIRKLLRQGDGLMKRRNLIIHGQWLSALADETSISARLIKRGYRADHERFTVDDLDQLIADFEVLTSNLLFYSEGVVETWRDS